MQIELFQPNAINGSGYAEENKFCIPIDLLDQQCTCNKRPLHCGIRASDVRRPTQLGSLGANQSVYGRKIAPTNSWSNPCTGSLDREALHSTRNDDRLLRMIQCINVGPSSTITLMYRHNVPRK
jgi:hypothetical protein